MMSVIVKTASRLLFPLVLTFGLYVTLNGHLTPGGGFQGGVVIAMAFYLLLLAYDHESFEEVYAETKLSLSESLGSLAFIAMAFLGMLFGFAFLGNWLVKGSVGELFSAGFMLPLNAAIGLKVAAGIVSIGLAFIVFASRQSQKSGANA